MTLFGLDPATVVLIVATILVVVVLAVVVISRRPGDPTKDA